MHGCDWSAKTGADLAEQLSALAEGGPVRAGGCSHFHIVTVVSLILIYYTFLVLRNCTEQQRHIFYFPLPTALSRCLLLTIHYMVIALFLSLFH